MTHSRMHVGADDFGAILENFERQQGVKGPGRPQKIQRLEPATAPSARRFERPATPEEDFGAALAAFEQENQLRAPRARRLERGQTVSGTILSLDLEIAFVDIGDKMTAQMPTLELTDREGTLLFRQGDAIHAEVAGFEPDGTPRLRLLARAGGGGERSRDSRPAIEVGAEVTGLVTGVNKGGVEVEVASRRAFCPFSQLADHRVDDASAFVGQRLAFQVTRVENGGKNLVLSRRTLLEAEKAARMAVAKAALVVGGIVQGRVTALADYGVFVDLGGGLEGMVHVSELSYQRIRHPKELVSLGQTLEVKVLKIEHGSDGRDRIALSHKALEADPWMAAHQRFTEGRALRGKVARLEAFGAFIELEPGVEGLVHLSELGRGRRLNHPREVLKVGQELNVKVQGLDLAKKRISLLPLEEGEEPEMVQEVQSQLAKAVERGSGGLGVMGHFFQKAKR